MSVSQCTKTEQRSEMIFTIIIKSFEPVSHCLRTKLLSNVRLISTKKSISISVLKELNRFQKVDLNFTRESVILTARKRTMIRIKLDFHRIFESVSQGLRTELRSKK
jgi:hypothetical protein